MKLTPAEIIEIKRLASLVATARVRCYSAIDKNRTGTSPKNRETVANTNVRLYNAEAEFSKYLESL